MSLTVTTTPTGAPLRVTIDGRPHLVIAPPTRWYEHRPWWTEQPRAAHHKAPGIVDLEVWAVQLQRTRTSPVTTIELTRDLETGRWQRRDEPT